MRSEWPSVDQHAWPTRLLIYLMVTTAGLAALSWELLWQLKASLSLGISAVGTAITLAATMGGMTLGALIAGRFLTLRELTNPMRIYGGLELIIGISGVFMLAGFNMLERIDSRVFSISPLLAPTVHLLGIVCLLGLPTVAMGATLPVFGLMARVHKTSIALLYGLNTGGAAIGVLLMAFFVIPHFGVSATVRIVASLNLLVALIALPFRIPSSCPLDSSVSHGAATSRSFRGVPEEVRWSVAVLVVFVTGLATFALEVAWFRSMRAAFMGTSRSFAIVLASVLIPLAIAAHLAPWLRRRGYSLGPFLGAAGVAILAATPLVERVDLLCTALKVQTYGAMMVYWFSLSIFIIGPPVLLLGIALPWLLEEQRNPRRWGRLYAANTVGAIAGAVCAAWILLPWLGFARTSWMAGLLVGLVSITGFSGLVRSIGTAALAVSLVVAITCESGLGRIRVQVKRTAYEVIAYKEGPDATVSVIEKKSSKVRELIIDGCGAASEHGASGYMRWMGTLPMLAHPDPEHALVICFGTGQTADAVRDEQPDGLDIVEVSPAVYGMAQHFSSNDDILRDPRVRAIVMDGRAWLRRCSREYDVVTLEPMPPYFASSNALYSKEFYELVAARLKPGGVVAQWVPFHMLPPFYAGSIAATFRTAFPNTILWVHPESGTGILVGRRGSGTEGLSWNWPGFGRDGAEHRLKNKQQILASVALDSEGMKAYVKLGIVITDDNQLLSFGDVRRRMFSGATSTNLSLVKKAAEGSRSSTGTNHHEVRE